MRCSRLKVLIVFFLGCAQVQPAEPFDRDRYEHILTKSVLALRSETEQGVAFALAGFELLTELAPRDPRGWDGLASVAIRYQRFEKAQDYLEYALQCDPGYHRAKLHLAFIAEEEGEIARALELYREMRRIDPANQEALRGLVRLGDSPNRYRDVRKLSFLLK